ncbi:MAG: hypothetical protein DRR42_24430 [Gammaproteobacteria bacterium]|nr:MAG: hypothetical protein DRR42_24430 [Gammaproteobacteria bacterium]
MPQYSNCITQRKLCIKDKCQDWHKVELLDNAQNVTLDADTRAVLFRNVRELLINVANHAHVKRVSISLDRTKDSLKFTVQDDGVGFDSRIDLQYNNSDKGFGLFSSGIV